MKLLGERNVDIVARFMHDTVNMDHVIFDVVDDDITLRRCVAVLRVGVLRRFEWRSRMRERCEQMRSLRDCDAHAMCCIGVLQRLADMVTNAFKVQLGQS